MSIFNTILNGLFDLLCFPFRGFAPIVGLCVISVLAGIALLILYKYTSPQKRIKRIKDQIKADLLEIRLYKDEFSVLTGAIGRLFGRNIPVYLGCNLIPFAPLIVVVLPLLVQLDARYGFEPLRAGDKVVVEIVLKDGLDPMQRGGVSLELPEGLVNEVGPVRIPAKNEVAYRARVDRKGTYDLKIAVGGEQYHKVLVAEDGASSISRARFNAGRTWDAFFHPVETPWPATSAIEAVKLKTHERADMVGIDGDLFPWLWVFCIVGLAFGFALKGVLKVNI